MARLPCWRNCIQISLAPARSDAGGNARRPLVDLALAGWAIIALLGLLHVGINAVVLAIVLVAEIIVIALFDIGAFLNPAEGSISIAPLLPDNLIADGLGSVIALGVAAFAGCGTRAGVQRGSTQPPDRDQGNLWCLVFLGLFYCATAWAMAVAVGPSSIVDAARDPESGIPFSLIEQIFGTGMSPPVAHAPHDLDLRGHAVVP